MKKKWVVIVIVILIGVVVMQVGRNAAYKAEQKRKKLEEASLGNAAVPVYVASTGRRSLKDVLALTGDISGRSEVDVYAKVPGKLIEKVKREESYVKKDEVIALVDRDESAMDYANAVVRAPISGTLTRFYSDIGGTVNPAMPLLNIADMDEVKIAVNVIEKDISRIKRGQNAVVYVDAYPGKPFAGKVDTMNQSLDRMTRTAEVRVVVSNGQHLLKPGMFARVELVVKEKNNVIAVPENAIQGVKDARYLFTVVDGKAVKKSVVTGISDGETIEIISGLTDNEIVVTAGQSKLKDGIEVAEKEKN